MDPIRWYLYYQLLVSVLSDELNNQPQIRQTLLPNGILRFSCNIKDYNPIFKIHFGCEFTNKNFTTNRCFENCVKVLDFKFPMECKSQKLDNQIMIFYDVKQELLPSGNYYCEYKTHKTPYVSHIQETSTSTTSTTTEMSTSTISSTAQMSKSFVKTELTIVLLGVFIFSLLLNFAFIIRCVIIRRYLDKYVASSQRSRKFSKWSWVTCLCLKEELKATDIYYRTRDDPYDKIRDHPSSETSKSKSSITNDYMKRPNSQDTEKLCFSSNTSQISRSSTFPARQSVIVHTPTDQFSISAIPGNTIDCFQPFMIQYALDPNSKTMIPIVNPNRRLSSHCIYDDVPGEHITMNPSSTMPIRHFASTGSLQNRSRHNINTNLKTSPLPEETQLSFTKFNKESSKKEEEVGLMMNECSSVLQDYSGSEETYLSGKDSDSMKDPVRVAKLEMSREMMAKADTLLREAHNLLKMS